MEATRENETRRERGTGRIWKVGNRWWIQHYDASGRQRRESSRSKKLEVAERLLRSRLAAKEEGRLPAARVRIRLVTVEELYRDKLAYLELKGKRTRWVKTCWNLRLKGCFGTRDAAQISRADLEKYQTESMERHRAKFPNATARETRARETMVNRDLAVLRMILNHSSGTKITAAPKFPKKLDGAMERCGTISKTQFEAMLGAVRDDEPWLRCLLTMAYWWGYRLMELLNLRCYLVDMETSVVYLPPRSTKNKHPRSIPISAEERAVLAPLLAGKQPEDYVFTRQNGKRVSDFRVRWAQLVTTANAGHFEFEDGVKKWVPAIFHDLRRTAVTNMLADGMPAENVRAVVGHFSEEMTDRYNQPAAADILRRRELAAARIPQLPNGDRTGIIADAAAAG